MLERLTLNTWRVAGHVLAPLVGRYLKRRAARGKEEPDRLPERLGKPGLPRPTGSLVWVHAASIGEALSVLPLLERLLAERPALEALFTTGTVTSARLVAAQMPARTRHQFAPVDLPAAADAFLAHWRPDLVLWMESEFWPNLIAAVAETDAPLVLVNGRVSPRSFAGWKRWRGPIRALLQRFTLCLAQSPVDAERLRALGASRVECFGNLKFAAPALAADAAELARLRAAIGSRPIWVAVSTHAGEEEAVAAVHRRLAARRPDCLTVIVPRHPPRGAEIAAALGVERRGAGATIGPQTGIYVADTLGELGLWCRLGQLAFVGGSLVPHGGQNPLEPARLDCALLFGPHMTNFTDMAAGLVAAAGARQVDAASLGAEVERLLLDDAAARRRMAEAARRFAAQEAEVLDRVLGALEPFLTQSEASPHPG